MRYYISWLGYYYVGDRQDPRDIEVTERPGETYKWDEITSTWVIDDVKVLEQQEMTNLQIFLANKNQEINLKMPTWTQVQNRCNQGRTTLESATTLAQVKPVVSGMIDFIEDMARILYLMAKNKLE